MNSWNGWVDAGRDGVSPSFVTLIQTYRIVELQVLRISRNAQCVHDWWSLVELWYSSCDLTENCSAPGLRPLNCRDSWSARINIRPLIKRRKVHDSQCTMQTRHRRLSDTAHRKHVNTSYKTTSEVVQSMSCDSIHSRLAIWICWSILCIQLFPTWH